MDSVHAPDLKRFFYLKMFLASGGEGLSLGRSRSETGLAGIKLVC